MPISASFQLNGKGPQPTISPGGRRSYTLDQINQIRTVLDENSKGKQYVPRRRATNIASNGCGELKGGSGKTTTAAHLAQYLALQGYRVLAVDLDPQASLTALHGYQPEYDIGPNETMYGAVRYDDNRRPLSEIIRKSYISGWTLSPATLSSWSTNTIRRERLPSAQSSPSLDASRPPLVPSPMTTT